MSELQVTAILSIHDGKKEQFKKLAKECMNIVRAKDKGTLRYDWYFNNDESECHVREHYVSSEAAMEHMGNLGETLAKFLSSCDMKLAIYGQPSSELSAGLAGMDFKIYSHFQSK